jgi:hypothetical protein
MYNYTMSYSTRYSCITVESVYVILDLARYLYRTIPRTASSPFALSTWWVMMDLRKMSNEGRCQVSPKTYENDPKRTFYECFIHTLLIRGRIIANHDDTIMDTPNDIETSLGYLLCYRSTSIISLSNMEGRFKCQLRLGHHRSWSRRCPSCPGGCI